MFQRMLQVGNGGGAPSFQFSTDEQKTNLKWTNGKPIYCKSFAIDVTSDHTTDTYPAHNIANIEQVIGWDGFVERGTTTSTSSLDTYRSTDFYFYLTVNSTNCYLKNKGVRGTVYVTAYYTKTTD